MDFYISAPFRGICRGWTPTPHWKTLLLTDFYTSDQDQKTHTQTSQAKKSCHMTQHAVNIGLVHHIAVSVFSCALSEECQLYCKVVTGISTYMP